MKIRWFILANPPTDVFWKVGETWKTQKKPIQTQGECAKLQKNLSLRSNRDPGAVRQQYYLLIKQWPCKSIWGVILLTVDPTIVLHKVLAPLSGKDHFLPNLFSQPNHFLPLYQCILMVIFHVQQLVSSHFYKCTILPNDFFCSCSLKFLINF